MQTGRQERGDGEISTTSQTVQQYQGPRQGRGLQGHLRRASLTKDSPALAQRPNKRLPSSLVPKCCDHTRTQRSWSQGAHRCPRRGPHKAGRARGLPSLDHSPAQQMPFLHHPRGLGSRDLTLRLPSSALSSSKHLPLQEDSQQSNQQMLLIRAFCFSFFSGSLALSLYQRTTGSGQTPREPKASESCFSETSRLVVSPCPCPTQEFTSVSLRELHLTPLPCPPAPHRSHPLSHHLTAHGR